jgi:broad specificity phosphatase PhoE
MTRARVYLVRHGRATASFAEAHDPGLDASGRQQAEAAAARLTGIGPLRILSSPLRRARETAAPLERRWARPAQIEGRIGEIPSPGLGLAERAAWLQAAMTRGWAELPAALQAWRRGVIETLLAMSEPAVVFTHYIAINVAVAHALGGDRVVLFAPTHCSVTILESDGRGLRLIERGAEAVTAVR